MPETKDLVINTGPLLALIAGIGDLSLLKMLYERVLVPFEVCQEIEIGGSANRAIERNQAYGVGWCADQCKRRWF